MINFKKFDKDQRSTFKYWFWHALAFNVTAIRLGHWRPKYLFHDMEKPWLMLFSGGDYAFVRKWHREHNRHHLSYKGHRERDWDGIVIDWECSHLTKNAAPMRFMEKLFDMRTKQGITDTAYINLLYHAYRLGVCNESEFTFHIVRTEQENEYGGPKVTVDEDEQ